MNQILLICKKNAENKGGFNVTAFNETGGTFMEGVDVEWNGSIWNYDNTKFWPNKGAISFYSYAPIALKTDANAVVDFNNATRTIEYTVPTAFFNILYAIFCFS